ncbi:MAG TPA: IS1595 family transposase, partial [Bacillota bacterium]|nr:IS1595 family transposase [Bacillota bacterium]
MSLLEFQQRFPDDDACRAHLVQLRWPKGFRCPRCQHDRGYLLKVRHLYQCSACGYQASVTAGTLLHRSRIPLRKWFWAIYLVTQDKRGVSAWYLSEALPLRYETAWFMLHKIRRAMTDRDDQFRLDGLVEMDDGYFGGIDHGRAGRGVASAKVVIAVS